MDGTGLLKQHQTLVSSIYRLSDQVLIVAALILTCRLLSTPFDTEIQRLWLSAAFLFYFLADRRDLYRSWRLGKVRDEVLKLWSTWLLAMVFAVGLHSLISPHIDTLLIALWTASLLLGFLLWRGGIRKTLQFVRGHGINTRSVAIFGANKRGQKLAKTIEPIWMGLEFKGFYDDRKLDRLSPEAVPIMGNFAQLTQDIAQQKIDIVFLSLPLSALPRIKQIELALTDQPIIVYLIPDLDSYRLFNARWLTLGNVQLLSLHDSPQRGVNRLVKRLEDIVLSLFFITALSPLMLLIAITLKCSSSPVFFKQTRYGENGKPIEILKFCTMRQHDPSKNIDQARRDDPRVTRIGKILRKLSADELPQFFNVLAGSMSIVGPRPHAVPHNDYYRTRIPSYMLRHIVKPGITGWAQINGWRGETDTEEKMANRVRFDLEYIQQWSIWMDLKIILLTFVRVWKDPNAY